LHESKRKIHIQVNQDFHEKRREENLHIAHYLKSARSSYERERLLKEYDNNKSKLPAFAGTSQTAVHLGLLSTKELLKDSNKNNKDKRLPSPSPQQPHPEHFPNPNNPNDLLQQPRRTIQSANSNNSANKKGTTRPLSANDVKKIHTYLKAANRSAHPIDSDKELHQLETMIIGRFLPPEQKWDATPNDNLFQSHYNHKNFYNRNQTIYPDANKPKYDSYKNYLIDRSVDILTVSQQQREEKQKKRQEEQLQQQRPHSHNDYSNHHNHSHQKKKEILILHSGDSHDNSEVAVMPGESFQKKQKEEREEEEKNRDQDQMNQSLFRPQSAPVLVLSYNSSPAKNKQPPPQQGQGSGGGPLHRILESGESQDLDEKKEEQEGEDNLWRNWNPSGGNGNGNLFNPENQKKTMKSMKSVQSSPNLLSSSAGSSSPLKQYLLNAKNVIGAIKTFRTGEEEEENNNNADSSTTAGVLSPSLKKNVSFTENVFVREFTGNHTGIGIGGNPLHNSSMRVVAPNNNKVVDKIVSLSDIKSPLSGGNNNNNNKSLGSVSRESFMSEITLEDPQDFAEKDYKSIRKAMTAMGAAQQMLHLRGSAGSGGGGSTSGGPGSTLATAPVIIAEEEKEQKEREKEKEMEIRRVKLPYRDFDGIPGASVLKSHLERNDYEEQLVKAHQTMISNRSGRTGRGVSSRGDHFLGGGSGGGESQPLTKPVEELLLLDDELFEALNIELISHYDFPIRCDNICNSRILGKKKRENKKAPGGNNNSSSSSVVQHNDIRNVGKVAFMIYETGYCIKGSAENYQIVHDYPHVQEVAETAKELLQEVLQKNPFSHDLLHTPMPNTKLFQQQNNNNNNNNHNKEEKEKEDQNNNNNKNVINNKIPSPTSSGKALVPPAPSSSSAHSSSFLAYSKLKNQNLDTSSAYLLTATGLLVAVYLLPHSPESPTRNKAFHFFSLKDLYEIFKKYANDSSSCYSSQASDLLTIFDEIFSFGYPYGDNNNNNNSNNTGGNSSPAHAIGSRKSSKHNNSLSRAQSTVNNMSRGVSTNKMMTTSPAPASPPPSLSPPSLSPPPPLLRPSDSFVHQPLKKTSRQKSQVFLAGKTFIESSYHSESGTTNNSHHHQKKKDVFIDQENEAGALVYPCLTDMTDQETLLSLIEILMNHIEIRRENDKEEEEKDEKEKEKELTEEEDEEEESVDYYCDESFEGNGGIGKNHSPNHNNNSNNNSPKKAKQMSKKKSGRKGKEKEKTEEENSLKIFV
jgi:hypothetical protein